MDITYLGGGGVKLTGRNLSVAFNPPEDIKSKLADVVVLSEAAESKYGGMLIDGPGEYEVKGALINGVAARRHTDSEGLAITIYAVELDGIRVALIGNIAPVLSDSQLEAMGQVDVLVIPVGGHGLTLDSAAAASLVSQIEPKYVVPVHFDDGKTKYAMPQDKVELFLSEMGAKAEPMTKLKLNAKELPTETTVTLLEVATS